MQFILTGSTGFIGSNLNQFLIDQKNNTLCFDRKIDFLFRNTAQDKLQFDDINIDDVDAVFHCAAAHPSQGVGDIELEDGNINLTKKLLHKFSSAAPKALIFLSSVSIYGAARPQPLKIESPIIDPTLYGALKTKAEKMIAAWGKDNGVITHCIRLPAVLGKGAHHTFLPKLIEAIKHGKPITTHQLSSKFNHIVHVDNLCQYLFKLSQKNNASTVSQLGSSYPVSIEMIIEQISQHFSIKENQILSSDIKSGPIDISSAERFGFKPVATQKLISQTLKSNC